MATILNDVTDVLHKIRVKLYPNYLEHKIPGKYLARTDSEATVTIEQICMSAKNRGGYTGDLDDMIKHVHRFLHEAVYLLC
ncbi:MAG: hypothetical protein LBT00_11080, partial [Spirochaetaceae bacterium]|nr:hypothetical protein [Spirochaetaceae bacterium]